MRLVLDTNVVMSGLLWRGTPHRLLQTIRNQHPRLQLYSSSVLLEELTDVIARPAFSERLNAIRKSVREVLADYIEIVELVEPIETPRVVRDPDDDHVLACALAAQTELIVSGDKDLLDLGQYQGIPIVNAADALLRLEPAKP
jgi:putative PIN family toxin of toxin-antitoxin system